MLESELTVVEQNTLKQQETVIERGLRTFIDVGNALAAIRDARLYRGQYATFEDYCQERWGFTRQHINRQIAAAATVATLEPIGSKPITESQARPLTRLTPTEAITAWQRVTETATNGNITARHVEDVAQELYPIAGTVPKVFQGRESHTPEPEGRDFCQSPPYAIMPILPYLPKRMILWEPAKGEGLLAQSLIKAGYMVTTSCILSGHDFFEYRPRDWDIIVTNPPWSLAEKWIERCFQMGKPFALLLKTGISTNTGIQRLNAKYGDFEFVYPESRIDYKMPIEGWGGAPFNTHWYTWGLNIGRPFTYLGKMGEAKKEFKKCLDAA